MLTIITAQSNATMVHTSIHIIFSEKRSQNRFIAIKQYWTEKFHNSTFLTRFIKNHHYKKVMLSVCIHSSSENALAWSESWWIQTVSWEMGICPLGKHRKSVHSHAHSHQSTYLHVFEIWEETRATLSKPIGTRVEHLKPKLRLKLWTL